MSWESITSADLGRYRVFYAVVTLLMLPSFTWLADYPDALYRPPAGPFQLLNGYPPAPVLAGLGLLVGVAVGCLLAGVWVRTSSWVATVAMLVGFGFSYSLGKIDHNLLFVLTPVVMLAAGWAPGAAVRGWVVKLWAFTVGTAILTAGLAKLIGGWLDPTTHAVQGYTFQQVYSFNLTGWLAVPMTRVNAPWVWEPMDWAAVLLECSVVVLAVVGLRWFRVGLALLTVFHVMVMLMLNIAFSETVVAYAGFVAWGTLRLPTVRIPALAGLPMGVLAWFVTERFGNAGEIMRPAVLLAGAGVSVWWLARSGRAGLDAQATGGAGDTDRGRRARRQGAGGHAGELHAGELAQHGR